MMKKPGFLTVTLSSLLLTACVAPQTGLDTAEHIEMLQQDQKKLGFDEVKKETITLSLQEALMRGVDYNLDAQVAALEALAAGEEINLARLNAFPSLMLSSSYIGRSNKGAASSRSILTNTQSLEPSYSTEQYRDVQDLSMNWNLINILLAVSETQTAKAQHSIAQERLQKVRQNIQKDIYSAYFRALAAQETEKISERLIREGDTHLRNLQRAQQKQLLSGEIVSSKSRDIQTALATLKTQQGELSLALTELKSLLSLPQTVHLQLSGDLKGDEKRISRLLSEDVRAQEAEALKNRPEVRELVLQDNINAQAIREEVIRTVPGAELFFAMNRDSNDFLRESQWGNFTLTLQQNLVSLLTYPSRKRHAENQKKIDEARRLSLSLAALTQVHLARQRLDYLSDLYRHAKKMQKHEQFLSFASAQKEKAGFMNAQDAFLQEVEAQIKKIELYQYVIDVQDAYATLNNTLGRDLLPRR